MIRIVFLFCISLTLLFLFLFIYKDKPRIYYTIMAVIGALVISAGGWVLMQEKQYPGLISNDQVLVENVSMEVLGSKRLLTGTIINQSPDYKLTSVELRVDLLDCKSSKAADCVIQDQSEAIIPAHIETGSSRNFTQVFYFDPQKHSPWLEWELHVTGTTAIK